MIIVFHLASSTLMAKEQSPPTTPPLSTDRIHYYILFLFHTVNNKNKAGFEAQYR